MEEGPRRFLGELSFWCDAETLENADARMREVIDFARERGLILLDGHTISSGEKRAFEQMTYGSTDPYRNQKAERGEWREGTGIETGAEAEPATA